MKASVLKLCPFRLSRLSSGPNMKGWRTYPRPLFEWRWADIAAECERYLAPNGFEDQSATKPSSTTLDQDGGAGTHSQLCTYFNANTKEFPSIPFHRLGLNDAKCNTGSGNRELYDMNQPSHLNIHLSLFTDASITQHHNGSQWFRPFIFQEVPAEYTGLGRVTEFKYGAKLGNRLCVNGTEKLVCCSGTGEEGMMISRGHGAGEHPSSHFWDALQDAVALMLAHPYGVTRVMSSFRWTVTIQRRMDHRSYGDGTNQAVPINATPTCGDKLLNAPKSPGSMVIFRNVVGGRCSPTGDNGSNFRCFRPSGIHFRTLDATLATGLPGGTYCDVISGQKEEVVCNWKAG
uniref:Uncharacterized protein n=1 Tax=Astyanax mexicanus TaxID=7994 RepID=A0A3B1JHE1_ASTMX